MEEHQMAARRVSRILDHVAGADELPPPSPHLLPMNCSSTVNSMFRRYDNRLLFARQGSTSQPCFMHQVSIKEDFRPSNFPQSNLPLSGNGDSYQHSREPMFARQAQTDSTSYAVRNGQSVTQDITHLSTGAPMFALPNSGKTEKKQLQCTRTGQASDCSGIEWSPRIDVAESGLNYIVTVELAGVSIIDIRVEVADQNLTVTGKRSSPRWRVANGLENLNPIFHRRDILHGPYRVVWPLPKDVNKDRVSAEFVDGFLQIIFPKL